MDRRSLLKSSLALAAAGGIAIAKTKNQTPFIPMPDGVNLFYREWGTGSPVVFLAPWGLHSDWWEYQMAYLSGQGQHCIAYDRRGHGRSVEALGGYDFDTLADDLNTVIEKLDLRGVTLVAHSMGSGEAVRFLSRHGANRIARLVLVAPITPGREKTADNPDGVDPAEKMRQTLRTDRAHAIAAAAPAFFGAPNNPVSTEIMQWWTDMLMGCSLKVLIELQRVFTRTDFRAELRTIALPTLIVQGDCDTSTPLDATGRKTAALIQGSQLKVYEGAAHGLPITHAARLNADLLAFIGRS